MYCCAAKDTQVGRRQAMSVSEAQEHKVRGQTRSPRVMVHNIRLPLYTIQVLPYMKLGHLFYLSFVYITDIFNWELALVVGISRVYLACRSDLVRYRIDINCITINLIFF